MSYPMVANDAGWALQVAIYHRLTNDAATVASLGGSPSIFDDVPRGAGFPYVTFGLTSQKDWGTGSEDGIEHIVTLHVWSRAPGRTEAAGIVVAIRNALHDQPLSLVQHRLVNLRQQTADLRLDPDGETFHAVVRFRAVTEPLT